MANKKQATPNAPQGDNEQASVTASSQSSASEELCQPQTPKEEEKLTLEEQEMKEEEEEEKSKEENMEVEPCSETAASSGEHGNGLRLI